MQCKNHPATVAVDRCAGCAEAFCANCLVEIQGQKYCSACKILTVKGQAPVVEEGTIPCKLANEALTYAIVGLFCFGIVVEPIALVKASEAKKMIELNPQLTGMGKVTAARVVAIVGLVLWILGVVSRLGAIGGR